MDDQHSTPAYDPFEMDWPWPGMSHGDTPDAAPEPGIDRDAALDEGDAPRGGTIDRAAFHERAG